MKAAAVESLVPTWDCSAFVSERFARSDPGPELESELGGLIRPETSMANPVRGVIRGFEETSAVCSRVQDLSREIFGFDGGSRTGRGWATRCSSIDAVNSSSVNEPSPFCTRRGARLRGWAGG